jgi:hypothetical protein
MHARFAGLLAAVLVAALSPAVFHAQSAPAASQAATQEPALTKEQMREFLLKAKFLGGKPAGKGTTSPSRVTLSDGVLTHDASFQGVDVHQDDIVLADGRREMNFVDSYLYNIAAYQVAELLGLDDMMPVTVERKWQGTGGAVSWWLPVKMDEESRIKNKVTPPDQNAWFGQMLKMRVFAALVDDTDRNNGNILYSADWKVWMIDFTRAFRTAKNLRKPGDLARIERNLWARIQALDVNEVTKATKGYLNKFEIQGLMGRRDKMVEIFKQLIATKGEAEVLY